MTVTTPLIGSTYTFTARPVAAAPPTKQHTPEDEDAAIGKEDDNNTATDKLAEGIEAGKE